MCEELIAQICVTLNKLLCREMWFGHQNVREL